MKKTADVRFIEKLMGQHYEILKIIKERENEQGFSVVSVPEIAKILQISQTQATNYVKRLKAADYVVKISAGKYKVNKFEMPKLPLYEHIAKLIGDITAYSERGSLEEQSSRLNISVREIQTAMGYISHLRHISVSMSKEERFVVVRADNHYYIMNVDQSQWGRHIATAKTYTEEEALDKIEEIEASNFEYRVYASPLKVERDWYKDNFE
jgi:CTP-dependent riboflavin kinase